MNNINLKNNLIIIGPFYMKESILKEIDLKYNIKYIDEYELKDKYLFTYENDILTYIDSKYNIMPEIGRIVL
ncbi:MAG TPA: hypothetical protein PLV83_05805, partial [Bacilli bacterium]|nr:hypothetical protein [Bacilli bacterium]